MEDASYVLSYRPSPLVYTPITHAMLASSTCPTRGTASRWYYAYYACTLASTHLLAVRNCACIRTATDFLLFSDSPDALLHGPRARAPYCCLPLPPYVPLVDAKNTARTQASLPGHSILLTSHHSLASLMHAIHTDTAALSQMCCCQHPSSVAVVWLWCSPLTPTAFAG
jgi:hypothetical protein